MKELVVVAIGGNSIIKDNASQSIEHQAEAVKAVADTVLEMLASDYDIVLTHGNRPQVGLDLRRAEIAHEREGLPLTPLANCVADTQGGIGYLIQQALNNLTEGRTTFIVAHRLSTIRDADRIAVIADGRCAEYGTYEELMALQGEFYQLKQIQS